MQIQLPAGTATVTLNLNRDKLIAGGVPVAAVSESASHLLQNALDHPLGYPALGQSILPGDRVTIGVDPDLPQAAELILELLSRLLAQGCAASDLSVLVASRRQRDELQARLPEAWRSEVRLALHDATDETTHAYLAATSEGRAVYLNRLISDADVFLPVGVQRLDGALDQRGVHGGWFPAFSNVEAQLKHQSPGNVQWEAHRRRRQRETEEAAWLLGVRQVVQVLPGPAGEVAQVWHGDAEEVGKAAGEASRRLWQQEIERPADLVIAVLDPPAGQQSWGQIARALAIASEVVVDGGVIVLWTELSADPGPALQSLGEVEVGEDIQRLALLKQRSADATAAMVIGDCLQRHRVFLRSQLADATVEEIGLASLHDVQELQRLSDRAATCLVISSAQHAGVVLKQTVDVP